MGWVTRHQFAMASISAFIVFSFAFFFHYYLYNPHDWGAFAFWIPIYVSPFYVVAGLSKLTEKEDG